MSKNIISLLCFCIVSTISFAQSVSSTIYFKSGKKQIEENINQYIQNPGIETSEIIDGYYYRYVQFNEIPTQEKRQQLEFSGVQILDYIPDHVYLLGFPRSFVPNQMTNYNTRSIFKADAIDKIDHRITDGTIPDWGLSNGNIKVILKGHPKTSSSSFEQLLSNEGISIVKSKSAKAFVYAEISLQDIDRLAALPFIYYIDLGPNPGTPEDTGGQTLQRSNLLKKLSAGGIYYDGTGVNILVRDDGIVGPHIDFEGRITDITGGFNSGTHGDGVAGVFAGAGNLDPTTSGSASGAHIYVQNYLSTFQDNTEALHQTDQVMITNSSYSDGCNAGYTTTTQTVDQQMIDNPTFMHVFSGGNSNGTDCGYGAGDQWGNITGGHKVGKNVIAVANLTATGNLVSSSSIGPAHDGRIKPDIAAHGQGEISTSPDNTYQSFGGTSAAAPTMAGGLAQLYQAYRSLNNGADPNAGLIKAVVLNSATDLGNNGPDYKFGWGLLHTYNAYKILEDNTYLNNTVSMAQNKSHTISVPTGVAEMRVMLYWTDPAASPSASKALINNLNLTVTSPTNVEELPWVLNTIAAGVLLDVPARKGIDNLNNVEQVSIDNPASGNYVVNIEGTQVPMGPQEYYLVWTFLYDDIVVTYPEGDEQFVPGEVERIHWDALNTTDPFTVEYSLDNGITWQTISASVNASERLLNWTVPAGITNEALIRVSRGTETDQSDPFHILSVPTNIDVIDSCLGGATLAWDAVAGADLYNVYQLGIQYMEIIGTTSALTFDISGLVVGETDWFSVQAITNAGVKSRRADAIPHFTDPTNINCRNTIFIEKSTTATEFNAGDNIIYTITVTSFYDTPITNVTVTDVLDPDLQFITGSLSCGTFNNGVITLQHGTMMPDETITCTFEVRSNVFEATSLIYEDDIEGSLSNWTVNNIQGTGTWSTTINNSNSAPTSWFSPNLGTEDNTQYLTLAPFTITPNAQLFFSHFYNTETAWDGGFLEISTDGGTTWTDLDGMFLQNGYNGVLGTNNNTNINGRAAFTGNSGGFIESKVDLNSFAGSNASIRFVFGEDDNTNVEGWYVDDISLLAPFYQSNTACVSFDQDVDVCSSISTLMQECITNCNACMDGFQNGDETGVDCGGSFCAPCPCTDINKFYTNELIPNGTIERVSNIIETTGSVTTPPSSTIYLYADKHILLDSGFETGNQSHFNAIIENCQN